MSDLNKIEEARDTLRWLRQRQLRIEIRTSLSFVVSLLVLLWMTGIIIESIYNLPAQLRTFLLVTMGLFTAIFFILTAIRIYFDPRLKSGFPAEEWWALKLGNTAPDILRDNLLNALQLNKDTISRRSDHSPELARHALHLAVSRLRDISPANALSFTGRKTSNIMLSLVSLICIVTISGFSDPLLQAIDRLLHPTTSYANPTPFTLNIELENDWAYRSEPVVFSIIAEGDSPESVEFIHRFAEGRDLMDVVPISGGVGKIEFDGFSASIEYYVQKDGIVSDKHELEIISRPQVAELRYQIIPPRYSGLQEFAGRENVGDIEALPGSVARFSIRATKALSEAWLVFNRLRADSTEADSQALRLSGSSGMLKTTLKREGIYQIRLVDTEGHANLNPIKYNIRLFKDNFPVVRITFPEEDVILGDEMRLPLEIEADDDYGISKIELAYRLSGQDSIPKSFPLTLSSPPSQSMLSESIWDLSNMSLFPGDVVEFCAVAWDNDSFSGPKKSESERRLVRLPTFEEIMTEVEGSEEEGITQAERTLDAAKELREKVDEMIEDLRRNPEVDWEKRREMEAAINQQVEIEKQTRELSKRIDDLVEKLEKHDRLTQETFEKYQELQNLMSEISTPELRKAMEKLKEAMASQDPEKVRQALEQFDMDREEFLERIERSLNILKQLQLERKIDELVRLTEELLHQEEEIIEKSDELTAEELAERQGTLPESMEMLNREMRETAELAEELGEEQLAAALDSLLKADQNKEIVENMQTAEKAFAESRMNDAKNAAEKSARNLANLSSSLKKSAQQLREKRKNELAKKLRRLAEELIYLSTDQENLSKKSSKIGPSSPQYRSLAVRQEDIRMALQGTISRLFAVAQESFFVTPDLGASLGNASVQLEKALKSFSDRNPRSVSSPQAKALGELNKSAIKILNILAELSGSSSSSGYEEMMEKLSQMASAQQGLNEQSMPMPGGEGEQMQYGGGDQFAKMAAQQRALQGQMQKLGEEGEGMQEILGDLEGIAKAMGEVADDMDDKNVNERTRRLQRQIVSRLLDATRSAKEREYSKRRESKTGRKLVMKSPPQLEFEKNREQLRRDLMRALKEGYKRDYQELIRNYFQEIEKIEEVQ